MPIHTLADRARFARERAGFVNEAAAAKAIKCSRPLVIRWESGDAKSIGGKYLLAASKAYQVRPEWLQLETDDDGYPWSPSAPSTPSQPERTVAETIGAAVRLTHRVFEEALEPIPDARLEEAATYIQEEVSQRGALRTDAEMRDAAKTVLAKLRGNQKWTKGKKK